MKHPNRNIILATTLTAIFMFGLSFAFSPLYSRLCQQIDLYAGKRLPIETLPELGRTVRIEFLTHNNQNLAWDFYTKNSTLMVHPNQNIKTFFIAKNNTQHTMTVQAIPSFTPTLAAKHFHKTECFCFTQQTLKPGESITMPVIFHIDNDLPKNISVITLAYTLFDITKKISLRE